MADRYEDQFNVSPIQIRPKTVDITGGQELPSVPNAPQVQPDVATLMAQALINQHGQQPASGVVAPTVDVTPAPAPSGTPAPSSTPDPILGAIMGSLQQGQSSGLVEAAKALQPQTPETAASYNATQGRAGLERTAAEDAQINARTAAQEVARQFPGQNPSMFPEGLEKTLPGGGTFAALPSGGFASSRTAADQAALIAARKANFARRKLAMNY